MLLPEGFSSRWMELAPASIARSGCSRITTARWRIKSIFAIYFETFQIWPILKPHFFFFLLLTRIRNVLKKTTTTMRNYTAISNLRAAILLVVKKKITEKLKQTKIKMVPLPPEFVCVLASVAVVSKSKESPNFSKRSNKYS